jgi:hypothetical protein
MHALRERFWATLPHIPIITIVWTSYLVYRSLWSNRLFPDPGFIHTHLFSSLPITPIVLTVFTLPIGLGIMHFKRKSQLVHDNAQEVYQFNIWLLKFYGLALLVALIGLLSNFHKLISIAGIFALLVSTLCIVQSFGGVATALRGRVFHYWYPFKKDF